MDIIREIEKEQMRADVPSFMPGDTLRVNVRVREGEKERIQVFEGICIARKGGGMSAPILHADGLTRCPWPKQDPLYVAYHDEEWGVPEYDDRALFEKLILDGFQAGLSWITILRKRENFRRAFSAFDPEKIAREAGASAARIARPDEVRRATGFDPGAVAPFPLPDVEVVLLERDLLRHRMVWVGAGSSSHMAGLAPAELVRLTRARPTDIVQDSPITSTQG